MPISKKSTYKKVTTQASSAFKQANMHYIALGEAGKTAPDLEHHYQQIAEKSNLVIDLNNKYISRQFSKQELDNADVLSPYSDKLWSLIDIFATQKLMLQAQALFLWNMMPLIGDLAPVQIKDDQLSAAETQPDTRQQALLDFLQTFATVKQTITEFNHLAQTATTDPREQLRLDQETARLRQHEFNENQSLFCREIIKLCSYLPAFVEVDLSGFTEEQASTIRKHIKTVIELLNHLSSNHLIQNHIMLTYQSYLLEIAGDIYADLAEKLGDQHAAHSALNRSANNIMQPQLR